MHLNSSCVKDILRMRRSTSVSTGRFFHSSYVILDKDFTPFPGLELFLVRAFFRGRFAPQKMFRPSQASTVLRRCRCRVRNLWRVSCLDGDAVSSSLLCLFRRLSVLGWSSAELQSHLETPVGSGLGLRLPLQSGAPLLLSSRSGPVSALLHRRPSTCFLHSARTGR